MVLTLYNLDASPPCRACQMVLEYLKLPFNYVTVNPLNKEQLTEEYIKMNPQHTIPTLVDDDFVLWDSHAVVVYLVTKYGKDDALYSSDPKKRALIDQRLHFDTGVLFPALRDTLVPIVYFGEKQSKPENLEKIVSAYDFTEKFLTKAWIAGDQLTVADFCCVATISSLNVVIPIDAAKYPNLTTWLKNCSELDVYKKNNLPGLSALETIYETVIA
ncbi:glutathione S-transferase 1-like [Leptidea sinapis]|uniref:glutathione S-transferase 1-like n=1 Tax=Leptidea sinapis TaxID=189913 RepID=UPI0021215D45|nr:glutathione S-transferase 1-like [Leptidea sinapis]XP_050679351.1 glutathione S-transferase 1-like [Leptidea sinapis]